MARRTTSRPSEGDWADRKAASVRAYREWMPVSDDPWESYEIGDLATLFRPETRLTARSRSNYLRRGPAQPAGPGGRARRASATARGRIRRAP